MNIIELAEQAGLGTTSNDAWYPLPIGLIHLVRFAELVAAAEREACAKLCEAQKEYYGYNPIYAYLIRGRSKNDPAAN